MEDKKELKPSKTKELTYKTDVKIQAKNDLHKSVIDNYFNNGFSGVKAVLECKPDTGYVAASALARTILKDRANKEYIEEKHAQLKASANVQTEAVLKELLTVGFSDVTDYIGLTVEEIKALPPSVRRCIASYDIKKTTYLPRGAKPGEEVTDEYIKIKLKDSLKAIDMINKYIGFYEKDNSQKSNSINLENVSVDNLNVLLQVAEKVNIDKG